MKVNKPLTAFSSTPEFADQLRDKAESLGISKSQLIRSLLEQALTWEAAGIIEVKPDDWGNYHKPRSPNRQ